MVQHHYTGDGDKPTKQAEIVRMKFGQKGLHVPTPAARPGDTPDFSRLKFADAGEVKRPDPSVEARKTFDLAFDLIRVLDDDGKAVGEWAPKIDPEILRKGLAHMMKVRTYDARMLRMHRQGKMSFYMTSTGEEAVAVAAGMALRDEDMLFPSYRQQGLHVLRGADLVDMASHCMSNARDNLMGRQLPVHYTRADLNLFSISGNLCTQFPQAVGWGMASAYKGESAIAASWIGEGSSAEGDFHTACTMAGVYHAPVILNVVNNQWAISSYQGIAGGDETTFASKAIGYGIPGLRVDGNDFLAVWAATEWAAERARKGLGATLMELVTYRAGAHSTSDDPARYRPKDEGEAWPLGDPIDRLKTHLIALGEWSQEQHEQLEAQHIDEVQKALKEAESYGSLADHKSVPAETMFDDIFKEMPKNLIRQREEFLSHR